MIERVVYKYPLYPQDKNLLMVGGNPHILHIGSDGRKPHVWVEHDLGPQEIMLGLRLQPTGQPFSAVTHGAHVGTFHHEEVGQHLIFHVYEDNEV